MDDWQEMQLTRLQDVAWARVATIQVKRYEVGRRMELLDGKGPVKSLPLLGTVRRFAVELVHLDNTWDRTHWLADPVEAHRLANEMAAERGLRVQVVL